MKKKIFYIVSGIIIIALVCAGIILIVNKTEMKISEPYEALPSNTALIIDIKNSEQLLFKLENENEVYKTFSSFTNISRNNSLLHFIDSLNKIDTISENIFNKKSVIAFSKDGAKTQQIYITGIDKDINDKKFNSLLSDKLKNLGTLKSRIHNESEIIEFTPSGSSRKLHFCVKENLLMISFSALPVEESINILKTGTNSLASDYIFNKVRSTAGKNEIANIYLNIKNLPGLFNEYLSSEKNSSFSRFKYFSDWTELDLNTTSDRINFNGFIEKNDTVNSFVTIPASQYQTVITSLQILPNITSFYAAFAFNDWKEYDKKLTDYLKLTGDENSRTTRIKDIQGKTGLDVKTTFYNMIENEICFATTNSQADNIFINSFAIFKVNSPSAIIHELTNMTEGFSRKLNKPVQNFRQSLKIDHNTSIECFILPFEDTPELLFGPLFRNCKGTYVCCIRNFVVFGNSKESLFKFVYDALLNNTLSKSIEHNQFLEHFSERSNMFVYYSFFKGYDLINNIFNEKTTNELSDHKESIYKLGNFGYQINKSNEMLYNNIVIKYSDNIETKSQTLWESRLDSMVNIKPAIVINHNDNSKEIMVQDKNNMLYLLSNSGRIIWKIQLDERIESKIYQIDFYKNRKLQYLFSTKSKIHLIDRLGNYIEKYPLKLRSASTAPMSLFDYDNEKNYRIIIPCENKMVYLYDMEGNIIKGWEFEGSENTIHNEISHYRIQTEDYIVFNDEYKPYFLSRTGNAKISYTTKFKFSDKNKLHLDNTGRSPHFVTTDENGTIRFFHTDGKQDSLFIRNFSPAHMFTIKDINSDGKNDYIFIDNNKLEVYNNSKKLILSYEFDSPVSSHPTLYSFPNNQIKIGVYCFESGKIYLVNQNGSLFDGFPLHGLSQFSIGNLGNNEDYNNFNLIVGGLDNLLYNYEIKY